MIFNKILIIGLGGIGGSFAKRLHYCDCGCRIYAYDLDLDAIKEAKDSKLIVDYFDIEQDVSSFDLIVLAAPLKSYEGIIKKIYKTISKDAIVLDFGSVASYGKDICEKVLQQRALEDYFTFALRNDDLDKFIYNYSQNDKSFAA